MFENLIICESQNNIAHFCEIGILFPVSIFCFFPVMPVHAIALNNKLVFLYEKINHEFIKHDDLLFKFNTVLCEYISHAYFNVGSLVFRKPYKIAESGMFFTAVIFATNTTWVGVKFFLAILTGNFYFLFPVVIIFPCFRIEFSSVMKAFQATIILLVCKTATNFKIFSALLTSFCNLKTSVAIRPVCSIILVLTLFCTKFCNFIRTGSGKELITAYNTYNWYAFQFPAFVTTKRVLASLYVALGLIGYLSATLTFNFHKKTSCLVNWVLAEGTQSQTRGNENYNRFSPVDKQLCTLSTSNYSTVYG